MKHGRKGKIGTLYYFLFVILMLFSICYIFFDSITMTVASIIIRQPPGRVRTVSEKLLINGAPNVFLKSLVSKVITQPGIIGMSEIILVREVVQHFGKNSPEYREYNQNLVRLLSSRDPLVRYKALHVINKLVRNGNFNGEKELIPLLMKMLEDKDDEVIELASNTLFAITGQLTPKEVIELRRLLDSENPTTRAAAVDVFSIILPYNREVTGRIIKMAKDPSPKVRANAAMCLGGNFIEESADELILLLDDPSERVRVITVTYLTMLNSFHKIKNLSDIFIARYKVEKSWRVKRNIISQLGRIGDKKGVRFILEHLKTDDPNVQAACIEGLEKLNNRREYRGLVQEYLSIHHKEVRAAVEQALVNMK